MSIQISTENGAIATITVSGELDGQTYEQLTNAARAAHKNGAHSLLLDLSGLKYISSAGLVALHSLALLMNGAEIPDDPKKEWASLKRIDSTRMGGKQMRVKLLNAREEVRQVLDMVGFLDFFETFTDKAAALASF
ncbi:MAG: hypothetical protein Fur002_11870 [Anaerolineales bacterium]